MRSAKIICLLVLISALALPVFAAETARTAKVTEINGKVEVRMGNGKWMPAVAGSVLNQGDSIRTVGESSAVLNVDGNGQTASVDVKKNSQLQMNTLLENKSEGTQVTQLDLSLGQILIKAKKLHTANSKFEVKTPTSIVGVRGTTFSVTVEAVE